MVYPLVKPKSTKVTFWDVQEDSQSKTEDNPDVYWSQTSQNDNGAEWVESPPPKASKSDRESIPVAKSKNLGRRDKQRKNAINRLERLNKT